MHGTTVLFVRKENKAVLIADGQVTMGDHVMKHSARKTRRLYNDKVIAGFLASPAGAESGAPCAFGISLSGCACATVTPGDRCSEPKSSSVQTLCGLAAAVFCCRAAFF